MSETTNGQHLRIPTIPAAAFPLLAAETAWFSGPPGWGLLSCIAALLMVATEACSTSPPWAIKGNVLDAAKPKTGSPDAPIFNSARARSTARLYFIFNAGRG